MIEIKNLSNIKSVEHVSACNYHGLIDEKGDKFFLMYQKRQGWHLVSSALTSVEQSGLALMPLVHMLLTQNYTAFEFETPRELMDWVLK